MTKIRNDGPQLHLPTQVDSTCVAQHKEVVTDLNTQQTKTPLLAEAQVDTAWKSFASQPSVASRSQAPVDQGSALRQQMNLNSQQVPTGQRISSTNLAAQLGIHPSRLAVPSSAQVKTRGSVVNPRIATGSRSQSAPLASARTNSGIKAPSSPSVRQQASAAFEAVVEQSFMTGDMSSDNMAQKLAGDPKLLAGLSVSEKGRLIEILKSGVTGNADEQGILNIISSAKTAREFKGILQMGGGVQSIRNEMHGSEANDFDFLMDRFSTSGMSKEHPLRKEALNKFDRVLRQSHATIDSTSDNMARDLANSPRMLDALTPLERGRLVQILGDGHVSEGDEEAMIKILKSSSNPAEFFQTVQVSGGAEFINSKVDWKEQNQFDYLVDKFRRQAASQPQRPVRQSNPAAGQNTVNSATPGMATANPAASGMNPMMGMNPMLGSLQNPWSMPPMMGIGMNTGYGMGMPPFAQGATTGFGNQFDLGIGGTIKRGIGNFFRGLVRGIGSLLKTAIRVGVAAGIGFMMGGPAGAMMNAAGSLLGGSGMGMMSMIGMMGGMGGLAGGLAGGLGGLGGLMGGMGGMGGLFTSMMGSSMPMMGMGGAGMLMGMF